MTPGSSLGASSPSAADALGCGDCRRKENRDFREPAIGQPRLGLCTTQTNAPHSEQLNNKPFEEMMTEQRSYCLFERKTAGRPVDQWANGLPAHRPRL
jgi:hypothetical protein